MNMSLAFSILSFFYIILISFFYFSREKIKNEETSIYSLLIIINILGLLTELSSTYLNTQIVGFELIKMISLKMIVIYFFTWMYVFSVYIYHVTTNNLTKDNKFYFIIIYIMLLFIMCILPLNIMQVNGIIEYTYGPQVNALYVMFAFLLIWWLFLIIKNRKKLNKKKLIPLFTFIVLEIFIAIIQTIYPQLLLLASLLVYVTVLMYFTIENPDVKMIEQLEIARDTANKANAAKTDFLSSMSHEIRTPLNAIVGFSECITEAKTLDEAKENAKDIVNASGTLLEIVNGILDISKIEAGKLEIVNSTYNAYELFNNLAKLITPRMEEKKLDFSYSIAKDLPQNLYGDPANIKKIVTNLLSNASKYTDKGYVRYEVNCINSNNICKLIISVEDTGRGIKKESIDKLFTKFQRLDEDKNTTIEGTGLGLAITKQLTELMGGKIIVHTVYGQGSKFTITINQKIKEVQKPINNVVIKNDLNLKDKKILIVDDNKLNLKVESKILTKYSANNIECVESGYECLDKINQGNKYDIILLDDMMPKMSGIETLKELKKINNFNIPVIALTANAITGMKDKYLKEGFNDYLAKPLEQQELVAVLNKIIDNNTNNLKNENDEIEMLEEKNDNNMDINTNKYDEKYLRDNNVDMDNALSLLGDIEMYNDTLKEYLDEIDKKINQLKEYKENKDMVNYSILVHSMKSDAKYLGFMDFAEVAYQHELKSKEKDIKYIEENFNILESELNKVILIGKNYIKGVKV